MQYISLCKRKKTCSKEIPLPLFPIQYETISFFSSYGSIISSNHKGSFIQSVKQNVKQNEMEILYCFIQISLFNIVFYCGTQYMKPVLPPPPPPPPPPKN